MNKIKAQDHVKNLMLQFQSFRGEIFCPLTEKSCNSSCECIHEPEIYNNHKFPDNNPEKWNIRNWSCENAMLKGYKYA